MAKQTGYSKAQCTINTGTAKVSSAQDRHSIYNTTMVLYCQSAPATSVSRYGHPCHRHAAALLFTPHTIPYAQQQRVSSLPGLPSVKPERSELSWLSFVTHTRPSLQPTDHHSFTRPRHASPQATTGDTLHPPHPVPCRETHPHAPRGQSNIRHSAISPRIPPASAVYSLFTQSTIKVIATGFLAPTPTGTSSSFCVHPRHYRNQSTPPTPTPRPQPIQHPQSKFPSKCRGQHRRFNARASAHLMAQAVARGRVSFAAAQHAAQHAVPRTP